MLQQDQTTTPADPAAAQPADPALAAPATDPSLAAPATDPAAAAPAPAPASTDASLGANDAAGVSATGDSDAAALQQMGFDHLLVNLDIVGWVVLITLVLMSIG